MSEEQINESTETTAIEAPSAPEAAAPEAPAVGGGLESSVQTEAPAWQPSYKYTVKGVEKEIDPMFRDIIKDAQSEEKVRRMFEQVDGVDILKQKFGETENKYKEIETKWNDQTQKLQYAAELWEKDKDQFFEYMGMDVQDIYKWVAEKLRMEQAPDNEKQLYNSEREARRLAMERERQLEFYQQKAAQEAIQARGFQLQQELTKADVAPLVSQYDNIYGSGSFETAVKQLGKTVWETQKVDLSATEAVSQVATYFKTMMEKLGGTKQQASNQSEPPVIPTIKAGASSPAKRAVRSLDDLKKLAAQQM